MSISRLQKAGVAVLDSKLLEGSVTVVTTAELVHRGKRIPIHIKGVVLGRVSPGTDVLSITIDLRQDAAGLSSIEDSIVSTKA